MPRRAEAKESEFTLQILDFAAGIGERIASRRLSTFAFGNICQKSINIRRALECLGLKFYKSQNSVTLNLWKRRISTAAAHRLRVAGRSDNLDTTWIHCNRFFSHTNVLLRLCPWLWNFSVISVRREKGTALWYADTIYPGKCCLSYSGMI